MNQNNNAITNALNAVYSQMFPGGKNEERILTQELYEILGRRIQRKLINQALCCALSSIILFIAKTKGQVLEVLDKRFESELTDSDKEIILQFAVVHNSMASLIIKDKTIKETI